MPANEGRDADSASPAGGSEAVTTAASGPDNVRSDLLTDDWKFILPNDTNFSEPLRVSGDTSISWSQLAPDRRSPDAIALGGRPTPEHGMIDSDLEDYTVAGVPVLALFSDMELGNLNPAGSPVGLDNSLGSVVGPADRRLNLDVMNRDFNPFVSEPVGPHDEPLVGRFKRPGETYQGKTFIPVKMLMSALASQMGQTDALMPLIEALSEIAVIRTPAHQFNLEPGPGNTVVFYGGESVQHKHVDKVVSALGKQHMRVVRQMVHFDKGGQGGSLKDIVTDGVGGSTHSGGYSLGYRDGNELSIKSDWPTNYGRLGNPKTITYNANLFAIDYQKGARKKIPSHVLAAYKHNADMWDCCAGIVVPFTAQDPDPRHQHYEFNPLEVYDQPSARAVAAALSKMNRESFLNEHGAFYCSEGQYSVANLGPQEGEEGGTLLKRSKYGDTALGQLITNFQNAPMYQQMTSAQRRRYPEIGWQYLHERGQQDGGISDEQYSELGSTDRTAVFLDWIPEEIPGWQTYEPKNRDGLIARPMTVVTMAWGILRRYLPRELIARAVVMDVMNAYESGSQDVKGAVLVLCGGQDPMDAAGKLALASVAMKVATGMLLGLMNDDTFRDKILEKAGYEQITNDADRNKVIGEYAKFVEIMKDANHRTQADLDAAVLKADASFGALVVERSHYNPVTGTYIPKRKLLMKYAAPASIGMWAQQPFLAETGCVRYVTTAMHVDQSLETNPNR